MIEEPVRKLIQIYSVGERDDKGWIREILNNSPLIITHPPDALESTVVSTLRKETEFPVTATHRGWWVDAPIKSSHQAERLRYSTKAFGSNMDLFARQWRMADWTLSRLDQLHFQWFWRLICQFENTQPEGTRDYIITPCQDDNNCESKDKPFCFSLLIVYSSGTLFRF